MKVAENFQEKWQFPHCLGAIDGKHVPLKAPPNSGSVYFNYKDFHSIVLLAVVDANYKFLWYKLGDNGRQNDAGIYGASGIASALQDNTLDFPAPSPIRDHGDSIAVPYMLIGDDAFPLKTTLMKPYPQRGPTDSQVIFNYRLSRARRVVENAFGILVNRFCVLSHCMNLEPHNAAIVTESCIALHNFLRTENDARYSQELFKKDVDWPMGRPPFFTGNNSAERARKIRDELCKYFWCEGQVHFQWVHIEGNVGKWTDLIYNYSCIWHHILQHLVKFIWYVHNSLAMVCCIESWNAIRQEAIAWANVGQFFWGHMVSLSHPVLGWLYVFSPFPPRPRPQKLFPLTSKPYQLNLWYLVQRIYGSGQLYWMTFPWPWPKVTAVASISQNVLVCAIKWEPLIGWLQNVATLLP